MRGVQSGGRLKPLNLQEVGTREKHYHELLDLWSDALAVLLEGNGDKPTEPATVTALRRIADMVKTAPQYLMHLNQIGYIARKAIEQYTNPVSWQHTQSAAIDGLNTAIAHVKHTLENTPGCGGIHGNYDERTYYRAVNAPVVLPIKAIDNNAPLV